MRSLDYCNKNAGARCEMVFSEVKVLVCMVLRRLPCGRVAGRESVWGFSRVLSR
jgi:hypothetical protein